MLISSHNSGAPIPIPPYRNTCPARQHSDSILPPRVQKLVDLTRISCYGCIKSAERRDRTEGIGGHQPWKPDGLDFGRRYYARVAQDLRGALADAFSGRKPSVHAVQEDFRETKSPTPLVSFHSISKGVSGEYGRHGDYFELTNVPQETTVLVYKVAFVELCPPLSGQIDVDSLVRPLKKGSQSYPLWKKETDTIHAALAEQLGTIFFPQLHLTCTAVKAAKDVDMTLDNFYSNKLLDQTGICAVSGTGFGQKEGESHFRLTCLCDGVEEYVGKIERFHKGFMEKYKD
ncbi:hypothetical protein FRC09_003388 [Ceratobasidium sp. 395]|nr:hypothetical protein FRC09_003388 [Ceratobasidium sp. 395]